MGSNNFLVFDANKTNLMDDADYLNNNRRQDGNLSGIAPSDVYNKLYYQTSVFAAAMGAAMAGQGQTVSDASLVNLTSLINKMLLKEYWHPDTEYSLGDKVKVPEADVGLYLSCITAGTSGTACPVVTQVGDPINDSSVVWQVMDEKIIPLDNNSVSFQIGPMIIKWGRVNAEAANGDAGTLNIFPEAFPHKTFTVMAIDNKDTNSGVTPVFLAVGDFTASGFRAYAITNAGAYTYSGGYYIALGW